MNDQIIGYAEAVIPVLNKTQIDAIEDVTEGKDHDDYDWDANRYHLMFGYTVKVVHSLHRDHDPPVENAGSCFFAIYCY